VRALAALALLAASPIAHGAPCEESGQTLQDCWSEVLEAAQDQVHAAAQAPEPEARKRSGEVAERVRDFATGSGLGDAASTVTDFLPAFSAAGLLGAPGDAGANEIALVRNLRFMSPRLDGGNTQLLLHGPQAPRVLPPLEAELIRQGRADVLATLERALSLADDLVLEARYAVVSRRWGRDFSRHRVLFEGLNAGFAAADPAHPARASNPNTIFKEFIRTSGCKAGDGKDPRTLASYAEDCRTGLIEALAAGASDQARREAAYAGRFEASAMPRFAALLANQPQLVFSAVYAHPSETVDAGYFGLRARLEVGFTNLNSVRKAAAGTCAKAASATGEQWRPCYEAYDAFMEEHDGDIDNAGRFSMTLAWDHIEDIEFELALPPLASGSGSGGGGSLPLPLPSETSGVTPTAGGVQIDIPGTDRYELAAGLGWPLSAPRPGDPLKRSTRLDLGAEYEYFESELFRNRRWGAHITLTYKTGGISVPLQLAHYSDSEFRDDLETADLTGLVGLRYDLPRAP
jgi:hypothetical protein